MAKSKKNGKKQQQGQPSNAQLMQQIKGLATRGNSGGSSNGPKKKRTRRRKSGSRVVSHGASLANFSPFARGFLDPFGATGVRCPDSVLLKSGTTTHKWFATAASSIGAPSYNLTTSPVYGTLLYTPIAAPGSAAKALQFSFTTDMTKSFFDYTANATPTVQNYAASFGGTNCTVAYQSFQATLGKAYRAVGGGVKLYFYNIPPTTPVDLYAVSMFNGDSVISDFGTMNAKRVRHFRLTGNDEIVLPVPIRHIGEAFEWINGANDGSTAASFASDDKIGTSNTFGVANAKYTASVDNTSSWTGITAWSPQSGLGGWQLCFNLPPLAGWRAEAVIHYEVLASSTIPSGFLADTDMKVCYANQKEVETVANVAGHSGVTETTRNGGVSNPWADFAEQVGNSTASAIANELIRDNLRDFATQTIQSAFK